MKTKLTLKEAVEAGYHLIGGKLFDPHTHCRITLRQIAEIRRSHKKAVKYADDYDDGSDEPWDCHFMPQP